MKNLIQKIKSYLPSKEGKEALDNLLFLLRESGVNINVETNYDEQEKQTYYVAHSTNLGNKEIIASGRTMKELDDNIKDAIFTLFEVPMYYTDFSLIRSPLIEENKIFKYAAT